ncbi:hypothetical protein ABW19_dt0200194 [Dactylella cylindrospora]|nr:hypothetical protein ABW19_dt0200194 [Dactylella cylindrospora]
MSNKSSSVISKGNKSSGVDTQNIISFFLSTLDRVAAPQTRQQFYSSVFKFCYQRPVLSSFLALQLLFALIPLASFVGFCVCTALLITATALGVAIFWVGVAGFVLFWTLVVTFTLAASTWLFLAASFISIRWVGKATGYLEVPPPPQPAKKQSTQPSPKPREDGSDVDGADSFEPDTKTA